MSSSKKRLTGSLFIFLLLFSLCTPSCLILCSDYGNNCKYGKASILSDDTVLTEAFHNNLQISASDCLRKILTSSGAVTTIIKAINHLTVCEFLVQSLFSAVLFVILLSNLIIIPENFNLVSLKVRLND